MTQRSFWQRERCVDRTGLAARSQQRWQRWWVGAGLSLARRPELWPTAVRQVLRLARPGWWRRWPPLPVPDPGYLRFRMETAYGDPDRDPEAADVVAYLSWCRTGAR